MDSTLATLYDREIGLHVFWARRVDEEMKKKKIYNRIRTHAGR